MIPVLCIPVAVVAAARRDAETRGNCAEGCEVVRRWG